MSGGLRRRRTFDPAGGRRTHSSSERAEATCSLVVMMVSFAASVDPGATASRSLSTTHAKGRQSHVQRMASSREAVSCHGDPTVHRRVWHRRSAARTWGETSTPIGILVCDTVAILVRYCTCPKGL